MKKIRDLGLVLLAYLLIYGGAYVAHAAEVLQISTNESRIVLLNSKCRDIGQNYLELQQPTQHILNHGCWIYRKGWYILKPYRRNYLIYYPKPN